MKIRTSQLKKLIREVVEESQEVNEISATARVDKPLNDLVTNLQDAKKRLGKDGAKRAISDMLQAAGSSAEAMDTAQRLLSAVTQLETNIEKLVKWVNRSTSTSLTHEPWAHVTKSTE